MLSKGRSSKNQFLSGPDQREYLRKIREAAENGDINAMGWMVMISNTNEQSKQLNKTISGWVGDDQDPKKGILSKIRENSPLSQQLPENKNAHND